MCRPSGEKTCPETRREITPRSHRGWTAFEHAAEVLVEVLHGEGGQDSKLFAADLADVYRRYAQLEKLSCETVESSEGHHVLKVKGKGAGRAFLGEEGLHCVQRVPPTERSGRFQTSFVAVAVLPLPPEGNFEALPERELEIKTQTGRQKCGGQNTNKVASAVRMTHRPTGLKVFINGRDQGQNRKEALRILTAKVNALRNAAAQEAYARGKSTQLASRGRGGKIRTYNLIDKLVTDHRTGRQSRDVKAVLKGNLKLVR